MILAEKIINLRKKGGYSQEEFADMLNVSRQAVSKWETAQSVPDLDKLLSMSKIFGVSTDYLLKDEIEIEENIDSNFDKVEYKKVSLQTASDYLTAKFKSAFGIAFAVALCIFSPVLLILLSGLSAIYFLSQNLMCGIGLISLIVLVIIAVCIFICEDHRLAEYKYISSEPFETEYGVSGFVNEKKKQLSDISFRYNLIGIIMCMFSIIPLLITSFTENELYIILAVCFMLLVVAVAVFLIVFAGTKMSGIKKLLQEGEYTKENKKNSSLQNAISTIFWLLATAIYLAWSFITRDWDITWIVWPIAGVLYAGIEAIMGIIKKK